ncbi:GAF domain-containing hybrid sensor histidine kinase/response regulator [Dethiosulfovibrio salsuginis]|uniref:histidine kinase n=1 Tax=Dethiosulfovibrio salsuginis TaxID=561720 RepID=A0A1X7JXB6_9BACT|nr:GAF domain-containing hybrid sensor histidine kinase/response regulator [Dethiosulfovibrio salsuginis]SMG33117.1 Signal transduction histidine kinase [Dethiosulfovibrio salsuginis]
MDKSERKIAQLELKIAEMTRDRERARRVLDDAVDALSLTASLRESEDISPILEQAGSRVRSLLNVREMAFFLLSEDGLDFYCAWEDPPGISFDLDGEKDLLVDDGTIAWALSRNRSIIVTSSKGDPLFVHSLMSQDEPIGVMMALMEGDPDRIMDISLAFITVILSSTAGIIKNSRLYRVINDLNRELRGKVNRLEESERELARANQAKDRFLANVSHEIRTPLNAILGTAVISKGKSPEEVDRALEVIRKEGSALLRLINDLLDLSKIDSGHMDLEEVPFDLSEIVAELEEIYRSVVKAKAIDLSVSMVPEGPVWITGDPVRLRQVMVNLLDNGIKFTHNGSVSLDVRCFKEGNTWDIDFVVSDTGIGISREGQSRLFNSFSQADSSTSRKYGGTGLGLAISQRIVQSMGGIIEIDSHTGEGTTFQFALSFEGCDPPVALPQTAPPPQLPMRILLVEDNETNRTVAEAMLAKLGHAVRSVPSGRDGLKALTEGHFDLVFMDIHMPGMDGLETTALIRERSSSVTDRSVPVVALTANVMRGDREKYISQGMDGYLPKPIMPDELRQVLSGFSPRKKAEGGRSFVLDLKELYHRMGGDQQLVDRVLDTFIADLPEIEASLRDGLASKDLKRIRLQGHTLKGASAGVGANGLKIVGYRLQRAAENGDWGMLGVLLEDLKFELSELNSYLEEVGIGEGSHSGGR